MLIIDTSLSEQRLLVTVTEVNPVTSGSTLHLHNVSTNTDTDITLPDDSSEYPTRYNEFLVPTSAFTELIVGQYEFNITDVSGNTTEHGLLVITDQIRTEQEQLDNTYIYPQDSADEDDFLVYRD